MTHWLDTYCRRERTMGYPNTGNSRAKTWGKETVRSFARKNGLRLVHGYETEALARMDGIGQAPGQPTGVWKQYADMVKKAYDATSPIKPASPGWDDVSNLKPGTAVDNSYNRAAGILVKERSALQRAGFPSAVIDWILIQDWMESGAFTNTGYKKHNNPGNIQFGKHNLSATRGSFSPTMQAYWANYRSLDDYARDKKRVLSMSPGMPINASSLADFVHRLKLNNYYGKESEASYLAKLQSSGKVINTGAMLYDDEHQTINDPTKKKIPWWQWGLLGLAGVLVIRGISR